MTASLLRHRIAILCLLGTSALLLAGCGELQDWRSTQRADTLEAYESFLDRHPQSQYAPVAQRRAADLLEQRDWRIATELDTAESYRSFLDLHPKGRWAREAKVRLQNFLTPPGVLGPAAIEPLEDPPPPAMMPGDPEPIVVPAPASPTASSPAAAIEHRIQLGAFSSRELAMDAWRTARERHAALQGLVSQLASSTLRNGDMVYRLQASVVSEARAREICQTLLAAGQPCVYVPPAP